MLLVLPGLKLKNDLLLIDFPSAPLAQNPMLGVRLFLFTSNFYESLIPLVV